MEQINNLNNQTLAELVAPQFDGFSSNIVRPQILATNFELKHVMFQMLQPVGQLNILPTDDPRIHLQNFVAICDFVPHAIRLKLFPFSLSGVAKLWLNSLVLNSITTLEEMAGKFI